MAFLEIQNISKKMETNFVTNVHEVVYASFLSKDCPANEVRILTKFYKVSFVVFKAGNVSYNAVMAANTIITDFFVSNHRLFAREIALEFVENIMTLLFSYDGFWDFVNRLNIHFFYLSYRSQILQILSYHMSITYGSEHFLQVYRRLPPYVSGAEDFSQERGKFFLTYKKKKNSIFLFLYRIGLNNKVFLNSSFHSTLEGSIQ